MNRFPLFVCCLMLMLTLIVLPANAQNYLKRLEKLVDAPVALISTGADREETIVLKHPFE